MLVVNVGFGDSGRLGWSDVCAWGWCVKKEGAGTDVCATDDEGGKGGESEGDEDMTDDP